MLEKLKSKKKQTTEITMERPVPDFIPYACHFDGDTILTKNGELLQTIKIVGFSNESIGSENMDLRSEIRKALLRNLGSDDFSLWIHTIRRKRNLDPGGKFEEGFSKQLNLAWKSRNGWDEIYVNEVYITIIRDGKEARLQNPSDLLGSIYFGVLKNSHKKHLKTSHAELKKVVDRVLKSLEPFGAYRLTVREKDGVCYSDQLKFFYKILNLAEKPLPMPVDDISDYISDHGIAVGFNALEVKGPLGRRFGSIFTLKEYQEVPISSMDKVLQLPQEFIITQTLDFTSSKKALKEFERQQYIYKVSGDQELSDALGLDEILKDAHGRYNSFGNSQITLFLINESLNGLEKDVKRATDSLGKLGMVATRRDLRMEECFWSQLPGNFAYLTRGKPMSTLLIGGLASLYNFPAGKKIDNHWGPAVTMLKTAKDTPYFFSFHDQNNGHTAIVGPKGTGKTVLLNFLVAQSQKFGGKLYFFDQERASKVFIQSIGGKYSVIKPDTKNSLYAFNPLHIERSDTNIKFLKQWITLLATADGEEISDNERGHLESLIDYIIDQPEDKRRLSTLAGSFGKVEPGSLGEKMSKWHGDGKYAHIFDNDIKGIVPLDEQIYGFGMSYVVDDKITLGPILSYLFHRIELALDGTPTMVVLDEAWNLVNNNIFAPVLSDWLGRMREKNAIVIFATETVPDKKENAVTKAVTSNIATQIFLPNFDADESVRAYKKVWGLSDKEFHILTRMRTEKHQFMLRQAGASIVASMDLSDLNELYVLSGGDKTVTIASEVISEKGDNPKDWLPVFYERVNVGQ